MKESKKERQMEIKKSLEEQLQEWVIFDKVDISPLRKKAREELIRKARTIGIDEVMKRQEMAHILIGKIRREVMDMAKGVNDLVEDLGLDEKHVRDTVKMLEKEKSSMRADTMLDLLNKKLDELYALLGKANRSMRSIDNVPGFTAMSEDVKMFRALRGWITTGASYIGNKMTAVKLARLVSLGEDPDNGYVYKINNGNGDVRTYCGKEMPPDILKKMKEGTAF